jgi:hypothetical protein
VSEIPIVGEPRKYQDGEVVCVISERELSELKKVETKSANMDETMQRFSGHS